MFIQNSYRFAVATPTTIYAGATAIYSLRKFFGWDKAVLQIRRSNDNALASVFIDGASSQDEISLNSYISTTSTETPDATTLATWLGSNDAFVRKWYLQRESLATDLQHFVEQATSSKQPKLASSGVIETKGGKIALNFESASSQFLLSPDELSALDSTNENTILTVTSNETNVNVAGIFNTYSTTNDGYSVSNSRRTQKLITLQRDAGNPDYKVDYINQQNTSNQKLITAIHGSVNNTAYYNTVLQGTTAHNSDPYTNTDILIGSFKTSFRFLNGFIQEIIIFPTDKTSDMSALQTDINNYYSIY